MEIPLRILCDYSVISPYSVDTGKEECGYKVYRQACVCLVTGEVIKSRYCIHPEHLLACKEKYAQQKINSIREGAYPPRENVDFNEIDPP